MGRNGHGQDAAVFQVIDRHHPSNSGQITFNGKEAEQGPVIPGVASGLLTFPRGAWYFLP